MRAYTGALSPLLPLSTCQTSPLQCRNSSSSSRRRLGGSRRSKPAQQNDSLEIKSDQSSIITIFGNELGAGGLTVRPEVSALRRASRSLHKTCLAGAYYLEPASRQLPGWLAHNCHPAHLAALTAARRKCNERLYGRRPSSSAAAAEELLRLHLGMYLRRDHCSLIGAKAGALLVVIETLGDDESGQRSGASSEILGEQKKRRRRFKSGATS